MQRARRVALVAVLALVGGLALAGCRSQPGTAVNVGSAEYSEKQVNQLGDELAKAGSSAGSKSDARHTIVEWIVQRDAARRYVAEKQWETPAVDFEATAQQTGLPANDPLNKLFAEFRVYDGVVTQHAPDAEPSSAEWTDFYQRALAAGLIKGGLSEQQFRDSIGQNGEQSFRNALGRRNVYQEAIKKANVAVNPKYGTELGLLRDQSNHVYVATSLNSNGNSSAVVPAPGTAVASNAG
jgi:hypothetical protein